MGLGWLQGWLALREWCDSCCPGGDQAMWAVLVSYRGGYEHCVTVRLLKVGEWGWRPSNGDSSEGPFENFDRDTDSLNKIRAYLAPPWRQGPWASRTKPVFWMQR